MRELLLAQEVFICPFDTGGQKDLSLVEVHGVSAVRRFTVPAQLATVLDTCKTPVRDTELRQSISDAMHIGMIQASELIDNFLLTNAILHEPGQSDVVPIRKAGSQRFDRVAVRLTLLRPPAVETITGVLQLLFSKWIILVSVIPLAWAQWALFTDHARWPQYAPTSLTAGQILLFFALSTIGALWHECGHASALRRCGGDNASIGWGVYLWFPVLYTDLSTAWRLPRVERVLVDVGGIYFHFIFVAGLMLCMHWMHLYSLTGALVLVDAEIAMAMNPFFKMDGYWVIADLLGASDLRGETIGAFRKIFEIGRMRTDGFDGLNLRDGIIMGYSGLSFAFFAYVGFLLANDAVHMLPLFLLDVSKYRSLTLQRPFPMTLLLLLTVNLLWQLLFIGGILFAASRGIRWCYSNCSAWMGGGKEARSAS